MKARFVSVIGLLLLAGAVAFAQTSAQNSSSTAATPNSVQSNSQNPSSSADTQNSATSGVASPQSNNAAGAALPQSDNSAKSGKQRTVEGCIVRQDTYFLLQPVHGKMIRLNGGSTDLGAHIGHNVRIHGTESKSSDNTASLGSSNASGVSAEPSNPGRPRDTNDTAATGSSSNPGTLPGANNAGGTSGAATQSSIASNAQDQTSNGAIAGSTSGAPANAGGVATEKNISNREIAVDRIDMISETCPANTSSNPK